LLAVAVSIAEWSPATAPINTAVRCIVPLGRLKPVVCGCIVSTYTWGRRSREKEGGQMVNLKTYIHRIYTRQRYGPALAAALERRQQ
jgi:hypothetical protein